MKNTQDFLHSSSCVYHDNAPAFLFTNENLGQYMPHACNLNGARVLTVAASGDQAFGAYSAGARSVDTFDINSNQRTIMELKTHMVRKISYENFMDFFFSRTNMFNPEIIRPIMPTMSSNLQHFMMSLYMNMAPIRDYSNDAQYLTPYLTDRDAYNALKHKLPEQINFVHTDIMGIQHKFTQRYDLIMLSNICESMYPTEKNALLVYSDFYNKVLMPLGRDRLNVGGTICFDYLFGMPNVSDEQFYAHWDACLRTLQQYMGAGCPNKFFVRQIPSAATPGHTDLVMMMQRTR